MAGEYYRWLARDVKPAQKRELTPAEKRKNWWHYHKWQVLAVLACVILGASVLSDAVTNGRRAADYKVAFVGRTALPEDTVDALERALAQFGRDLTGDGQVRVEILEYQFRTEDSDDPAAVQQAYATSMQLMLNVETTETVIYLLEDPEAFAAAYPILLPVEADGSLWHRWADCPVLTALELGNFRIVTAEGTAEQSSQAILENICIARRSIWDTPTDMTDAAQALFAALTENAG